MFVQLPFLNLKNNYNYWKYAVAFVSHYSSGLVYFQSSYVVWLI